MTATILDTLFNYLVAVEDINGKVLGELNQETVKELGVKQIGRQLALLKMIKSLLVRVLLTRGS